MPDWQQKQGGLRRLPALTAAYMSEDSEDDRVLIGHCLQTVGSDFDVRFFENGAHAIAFLSSRKSPEPLPAIIILDIKLPGISGFEILQWIRSQPDLAATPVAMLSSSNHNSDRQEAARLGANAVRSRISPAGNWLSRRCRKARSAFA
jgi:CheY-like chemotaxis protein